MLLERLREYSLHDLGEIASVPAYEIKPVQWIVQLDRKGRYLGPVDTADAGDRSTRNGIPRPVPWNGRTTDTNPRLLVDNAEYVLGKVETEGGEKRANKRREAYRSLLEECLESTKEEDIALVLKFLDSPAATALAADPRISAKSLIAFSVDGRFLHMESSVQEFWAVRVDGASTATELDECIVCGQFRPAARIHPKVIGIPKGQGAGLLLVSANEDAFLSYGRDQSLIAPTCMSCSQDYARALNSLLKTEGTHFSTSSVAYAFWSNAQRTRGFVPVKLMTNPPAVPSQVRELFMAPWTTNEDALALEPSRFYAVALSANSARVVVRTWIDTTVSEAKRYLARYFELQRVVQPNGDEARLVGIQELAASADVANRDDRRVEIEQDLLKLAFVGGELSLRILHGAIRRCRADCDVSHQSARLIKMALASREERSVDFMVQLDEAYDDKAYLCGRMLQTLSQIQRAALGETNSTVVNRYYGAASSAPFAVFPRLITVAQGHFARLERQNMGAKVNLERQLMSITDLLDHEFPASLDARAQGRFALGFYHQRAAMFRDIQRYSVASQSTSVEQTEAGPAE